VIKFVARPERSTYRELLNALRLTATNGKAVRVSSETRRPSSAYVYLKGHGLRLITRKNGRYLYAWCEKHTKGKPR